MIGTLTRRFTLLALAVASMPGAAETIAITGATVHTMGPSGTLNPGTVVIEDGVIRAVGRNPEIPPGATIVDAAGKVVTPGLFDAGSAIGLVEISLEDSTVDFVQRGDRFTAAFDVSSAINPRSTLIGVNRIEGVTRALVLPSSATPDAGAGVRSSVISGLGAVISLGGHEDFLTRPRAVLAVQLGADGGAVAYGSRAEALLRLESALHDAADYAANADAFEEGRRRAYSVSAEDLAALQPVLAGAIPLVVRVDRASDIRSVLALVREFDLRAIVFGGAEAWRVADELAAAGVPVVLDPLSNLPANFDLLEATLENASRLHTAGVRIAFASGGAHNVRNMTQAAGNAVANGLPWHEGLRAITRTPAEILGLDDRLGAIEAGLIADLVVWDGDPLEVTTFADQVFIGGEAVPIRSRQTLLRDRYLDLGGPLPPAYRQPWQTDTR